MRKHHTTDLAEIAVSRLDPFRRRIQVHVQGPPLPVPLDLPRFGMHVVARLETIVERQAQDVVIDAVDRFPAGEFEAVPALLHLMQAEQFERELDAMAECRGALDRPLNDAGVR